MENRETKLQKAVCNWIRLQYPKVLFNSDLSGAKLTKLQAINAKENRSQPGFPDLFIIEKNAQYNGLFLELKAKSPYLKNGKLSTNKHIQEQNAYHVKLRERGFKVEFCWSVVQAIELINNYMNNKN